MAKKKRTKSQVASIVWESIWLSLFGIFSVTGVVMGILGVCAHNIGWNSRNPLYSAETNMTNLFNWGFRIDWRIFGAVLIFIGMLGIMATLFYFAQKYDKAKIKAARREERLKAILAEESNLSVEAAVPGFINPQSDAAAKDKLNK